MTADTYADLDAAYLLGALDADERLAYEAHLATRRCCRASLADIRDPAAGPCPRSSPLRSTPDCRSLVRSPAAAQRRHMRTLRSRQEETGRPGESGEVAGVVDAMDGGESAAVPLDLVNAGGAKI
jgi:anti-sigma factor RsiW